MQATRAAFVQGASASDPLAGYCAWQQAQANPNFDYLAGYGDGRDGAIKSDANDALYLLYAVVLKYRCVANVSSACVPSPLGAAARHRAMARVVCPRAQPAANSSLHQRLRSSAVAAPWTTKHFGLP